MGIGGASRFHCLALLCIAEPVIVNGDGKRACDLHVSCGGGYTGHLRFLAPQPLADSAADLVVRNATIYTSDASIPFAEAMAVRNGRILRIGTDAHVRGLIGYRTHELNLEGKVVLPGFIDSHVHLISGGLQMGRVKLQGIKSKEDFVMTVKEAVKDKLPGDWLLGGGWNNDIWGGELPDASWIDDITRDKPVWFVRMDGHMGLANSLALKLAGITNSSLDPVGGTILKTSNGADPTGLLIDSAMKLVLTVIPEISVHERQEALITASKYALMKGVTTMVDMGRYFPGASVDDSWQDLSDVYKWADSSGKMLIRVCLFFPLQTWSRLRDLFEDKGRSLSQWIYLGGVKAFADGSLGSNSALFHEPYEDDPHNYGLQVSDFDWLFNAIVASDKTGLQVAVHAIGDKANDMVLDLFNSVKSVNEGRDHRFRIEHAQHLVPEATSRFGVQSVIASVQPDHILDDASSAEKKIGKARAQKGSYLFRSLLAGGAKLAFGSDWPVADIDPLRSIKTAMTRIPPGQETAWIPSERVGLDDALNAYTIGAAYACFLDNELGSLSPGKYADFLVLPSSSWEEFKKSIPSSVSATYVSGLQAYP
ncbi:hypothetical protein IEQ34_016351 [Dendrobium chrysotoxum]|uniref:Amidohydrolase 3 domain-containing protein n=1 Tax=Dendrobium chrysotoxum TaxID=161865 RepID=A0AAV7GFV5_DENCH|nr:hypothetical protein IEQ34_016351 [Dendrobium chrysotoxum]